MAEMQTLNHPKADRGIFRNCRKKNQEPRIKNRESRQAAQRRESRAKNKEQRHSDEESRKREKASCTAKRRLKKRTTTPKL